MMTPGTDQYACTTNRHTYVHTQRAHTHTDLYTPTPTHTHTNKQNHGKAPFVEKQT